MDNTPPHDESRLFGSSLKAVADIWARYRERKLNDVISPLDDMIHPEWDTDSGHYRSVGINAIEIVLNAMLPCRKTHFDSILDMPCGFGRVTRHLAAAFPKARLYACDLYDDRIEFCAKEFGAIAVKSNQDFRKIVFPEKFDLIWCGSLLTHLPEREFNHAIRLFVNSLAENGVAIITTLGRASPYIHRNFFKYLPEWIYKTSRIESKFLRKGFGYADYHAKKQFFEQDKYGITFVTPSYLLKCLGGEPDVMVRGFFERVWDDQQDAVVIHKVPITRGILPDRSGV